MVIALIADNPITVIPSQLFNARRQRTIGIHPSAVIADSAIIAATAAIGAHCTIGEHVTVGEHTEIGPNVVIEDNSCIGNHCLDLSACLYLFRSTRYHVNYSNTTIVAMALDCAQCNRRLGENSSIGASLIIVSVLVQVTTQRCFR